MKITDNETQWAKIGRITSLTFVGKETLLFGTSCHLIFVNLHNNEELIYTANHQKVGDGISCFTGHRSQNIFAFAEKRTNPNIFIKTYPSFEEVRLVKDAEPRGYTALSFTETSLLITLGDLPQFNLTIWNWRKGEKLANKDTLIFTDNQMLRSNLCSPVVFAQLGIGTNKLHVWDIFVCGKKSVLTQHIVKVVPKSNPFTSILWTTENALFVLDTAGCVYTMLPNHHLEKVIDFTEKGNVPTSFAWYKFGLVILGPTNEIRHYKKAGGWSMDWSIEGTEPLIKIFARGEYLVALTKQFNLFQVLPTQNTFNSIKKNESEFNDICLINPTGQYLMALCHRDTLNLYQVSTGQWISTFSLNDHGYVLTENPRFPYVAVGLECGNMVFVSAYKPEKLVAMTEFHLTRSPIDSICFNECGTIFVAANLTQGLFFIIEGIPGGQMEVIKLIKAHQQIADYMMILSENCYRIFCIPVTSNEYLAGDKILRFCYIKDKKKDVKKYKFEDKKAFFIRLCALSGLDKDRKFYAVPLNGKCIKEIGTQKFDDVAKITNSIPTGHQMKDIFLRRNKTVILTWSVDGFVIVRSADFTKNIAIALPHHRMEGGVKKAYIDPHQKFLVSLGRDKVLVCTNLKKNEINADLQHELEAILHSSNFRLMFNKRTTGYIPKGIYEGKCYVEVEKMKKIEKERAICHQRREEILKEFKSIQSELQRLINGNLEGPENEKLDLIEFNLNKKLYQEKCLYQSKLRAATEIYLKQLIEAQNRVSDYIMKNFWERMKTREQAIRGIFANFEVKNYALLPQDQIDDQTLAWIKGQRSIEEYLSAMDHFHPWKPIPEKQVDENVHGSPSVPFKQLVISLQNLDEDLEVISEEEKRQIRETEIAFSGSDLARFIDVQDTYYPQVELITYYQAQFQWKMSKSDSYKLKEHFNKQFDSTMNSKIKDMNLIKSKNDRLRHIVSEKNYFLENKFSVRIEDPEWTQVENPELIVQVKDEEVPITPYISPSEQARLDAIAAEEERLRLLLLADDFRERALMAMMNGVLEVRWEDEIKKDVPLPKCMIEKQPENFNEDDLRAVKEYEKKVEILKHERERYKNMLNQEYQKVSKHVREQIHKFNDKLSQLLYYKLEVDAAISQETLKAARFNHFLQTRSNMIKKEEEYIQKITHNDQVIRHLHFLVSSLQDAVTECKSNLDSLQSKDKTLEKAFKKDFQDMSLVIQEQAAKLYKKRPKFSLRSVNSATLLNKICTYITSCTKPPPTMTADCVEFLKSLDQLDQYVGVPSVVDEHTYALICKHRRLRIEYEVKCKAAQRELIEAETTLTAFNRRIVQKKEEGVKLAADLASCRQAHENLVKNRQIQFVLPRGLVELPLTGNIEDFEDALLANRTDVNTINQIIIENGEKKICSLKQGIILKRKILAIEWEHKRMRMLIQDLDEKLADINQVRLTKEIQFYLKSKDKEKMIPFETEVDMIKASYENTIQDRKDKVNRLKKQIRTLQANVKMIDEKIQNLNVDVCEMDLQRDKELDEKERAVIDFRITTLLKRSNLIQKVHDNHHEIMMLQTELELLRLKTYPVLKFTVK